MNVLGEHSRGTSSGAWWKALWTCSLKWWRSWIGRRFRTSSEVRRLFSSCRRCGAGTAVLVVALLWFAEGHASAAAPALDRPPAADEVSYRPEDGATVAANPPAFVWLPHKGVKRWIVEYSTSETFAPEATTAVENIGMTVYIPGAALAPGAWYWRYGDADSEPRAFSRGRRFTIPDDAVVFPYPGVEALLQRIPRARPRAYFTLETVAEIRSDPERFAWLVAPVVRGAEAVLKRNEPLFPEPKPWGAYENQRDVYNATWRAMRPYTSGMETCARAYLFTGDRRFAAEARRRLMHFMTWDVDGPSSVYWPTELGMDIGENAPRTFDWIHDALSDGERATCLEVLGRRIRQINAMHRGRPFESKPFSSHPGRMIGFAVEGAIILAHDVEDAPEWLDYTLKVLWSTYPAWGRSDGGWHEGVGYWTWYMGRIFRVVTELDRLGIPLKDKPFFQNTGDFGLYAAYPHRRHRAFGDGYEGGMGNAQANLMYVLSSLYANRYYRWYAEQMNGEPTGPEALHVLRPDIASKSPADLPQSRAFFDVGLVAMHSRMEAPKDNVLLLFQSNPFGAISHNHANQNAFVLEAFGQPLAISSGYYQNYGSPHHSQWIWQTKAHNAMLVDGKGQVPRRAASHGRIVAHAEAGGWAYALGDAAAAYGGRLRRCFRHVLFVRPRYFVMVDDVATAGGASTYQWLLHAMEAMDLDEALQRVTVRRGEAGLRVQFVAPAGLRFSQESGWDPPPDDPDRAPAQFHFTAATPEKAAAARIAAVLMPYRRAQEEELHSPIEWVEAEGGTALRVGAETVLIRHPDAAEVRAAGHRTANRAAVVRDR